MRILHLTLKKKWFDMILSGEKKEEYREKKPYWINRLTTSNGVVFRHFDIVQFTNGYASNAPTIQIQCLGISEGLPRPEWSDNAQGTHIIISLGDIISTQNI